MYGVFDPEYQRVSLIIFSEFSVKINVEFNGKPFPDKISAQLLENPKEIKFFYDNQNQSLELWVIYSYVSYMCFKTISTPIRTRVNLKNCQLLISFLINREPGYSLGSMDLFFNYLHLQ